MFGLDSKKNKGDEITFKIEGMHCSSCAMNIDGELEDTEGVIEATTSYAKAQTKVVYNSEKISPAQMKKVIKKAGYTVE